MNTSTAPQHSATSQHLRVQLPRRQHVCLPLYTVPLKPYWLSLCCAALLLLVPFTSSAASPAKEPNTAHAAKAVDTKRTAAAQAKSAIILTLFGSSDPAVQAKLEAFSAKVQAAFPQQKVEIAYTATRAREAMRVRGKEAPSVAQALAALPEKKIFSAVVQSLHIMPGYEYHDTMQVAKAIEGLPKGLQHVCMGPPLISNAQALDEVATALLASLPPRQPDEGILFVGHGTDHLGGLAYPALQYALSQRDSHAFVSTLASTKFVGGAVPSLEAGLKALQASKVTKVTLVPLMTVAGVHVKDDIAGADEESVRSQLQKAGYTVTLIHKGLLEMPAVQDIYIRRIGQSLSDCAD